MRTITLLLVLSLAVALEPPLELQERDLQTNVANTIAQAVRGSNLPIGVSQALLPPAIGAPGGPASIQGGGGVPAGEHS